MPKLSSAPVPYGKDSWTRMQNANWSAAEKAIARKAFDAALQNELNDVIEAARRKMDRVKTPEQL